MSNKVTPCQYWVQFQSSFQFTPVNSNASEALGHSQVLMQSSALQSVLFSLPSVLSKVWKAYSLMGFSAFHYVMKFSSRPKVLGGSSQKNKKIKQCQIYQFRCLSNTIDRA